MVWIFRVSLTALGALMAGALGSSAMAQGVAPTNLAQGTNVTCTAAPADMLPIYLRGSMNGWTAQDDFEFVWDCNAWYLNVNLQGEHEFKLADAQWRVGHSWSTAQPAAGPDALLMAPDKPGVAGAKFRFSGAHTLRLSRQEGHVLLQVQAPHFVDPRQQPVTDPVALSLRHDSRDLAYRSPFGAVPQNQTVRWALRALPGVEKATLVLDVRRLEGNQEVLDYRHLTRIEMQRTHGAAHQGAHQGAGAGTHELFKASYRFKDKAIHGYWFEVVIGGVKYVYQNNAEPIHWTQEKGSGGVGQVSLPIAQERRVRRFRITVYDPAFKVPAWAQDAVYYFIFPERFRNGNLANDPKVGERQYQNHGIEVHGRWGEAPFKPGTGDGSDAHYNNDFFGGDLQGIIDKLDDIRDLGANAIYMTPVFKAASNHKYDTADYHQIDPAFGTNADFIRLTREAAKRGIRIIPDASLNHVGADSRYFDRFGHYSAQGLGAFANGRIQADSPYASWFTFDAAQTEPDRQFKGWVGVSDLPELNKASPSWRRFAYGDRDSVTRTWLRRGAAGWRMDVAPWVPDDFWREWRLAVKQTRPDAITIAETWFDASKYLLGDTFDSTMNYVLRNAVLDFANGSDARKLVANVEHLREAYPRQAFHALMNLLSSHDQARALHVLGGPFGAAPDVMQQAKQKLRLATLVQMTLPGSPTVYYGDEVGLSGGDDPYNRMPYPWADQGGQPDLALRSDFKALLQLRHQQAVLRRGTLQAPLVSTPHLVVLARQHGSQTALMAYNNSEQPQTVTVDLPAALRGKRGELWWGSGVVERQGQRMTLTVPPMGGWVWGTR
ncbi:alpha-amylase family glycosyl hydrolase [Limnohabitans sp. 2KL-1]|uniref:alpha-amylase family glycosyl hydrolase n=1 Tax=Limnohabitans sp. 2KL-1 TaxID=1100699 RepID=UPI001304B583|nr:alpha-amylase family glycosyl hydrolase [Limnohabitans sp. 2KL-1]